MSDYSEKFKDPRWQKKRLEMFQDAGWKCERCDSKTETLNLHHKFYKPNTDPWNYENHWFMVLCDECHKELHDDSFQVINLVDTMFKSRVSNSDLKALFLVYNIIGSDESGFFNSKLRETLVDIIKAGEGLI